jgi:hypothetical protein
MIAAGEAHEDDLFTIRKIVRPRLRDDGSVEPLKSENQAGNNYYRKLCSVRSARRAQCRPRRRRFHARGEAECTSDEARTGKKIRDGELCGLLLSRNQGCTSWGASRARRR